MLVAIIGIVLLAIAFLAHLIVWRLHLPRNHTQALLLIFLVTPLAAACLMSFVIPGADPFSLWEILHLLLFYTAMSLVYVIGYSAIEQDSALLATYAKIENAGAGGITEEDLAPFLEHGVSPRQRLELMIQTGLAERRGENYALTQKGACLARLFACAERIFGLPQGG